MNEMQMEWKRVCYQLPLICAINTYNNELTIYACLQQAIKNFDYIVVVDDGSTDNTFRFINRFIEDYNPKNLSIVSVDHIDPWPDQLIEKDHGPGKGVLMKKTHAKSKAKSFAIVKGNFQNSIYVSLEADVIVSDDARSRIYERVSRWNEPMTDVEYFNLVMTIDTENVRAVSKDESKPVFYSDLNQRKIYDHPGDWTLACFFSGGETTIGPDPVGPYGACTLPWSRKNQCLKKGQDNEKPFGFHMLSYNNNELDIDYKDRLTYKISDLDDPDVDFNILNRVFFPKVLKLDDEFVRYIESEDYEF